MSDSSSQWLIRVAQLAAGFSRNVDHRHQVIRPWPHVATRHSFATYALTSDPGRVSLWIGYEGDPQLLYLHYRDLATHAEGESYFALKPPDAPAAPA